MKVKEVVGFVAALLFGLLWFLPLFVCHFQGGCR